VYRALGKLTGSAGISTSPSAKSKNGDSVTVLGYGWRESVMKLDCKDSPYTTSSLVNFHLLPVLMTIDRLLGDRDHKVWHQVFVAIRGLKDGVAGGNLWLGGGFHCLGSIAKRK